MNIKDDKLEKLNKKFRRKRLINIYFLIRKLLKSQGNKEYIKKWIKSFSNYKEWLKYYQQISYENCIKLTNSFMKKTSKQFLL